MTEKNFTAEIKELGDKIVALTLMQAKELVDYLKEQYGIEPAAGGAVMMAPAAGAGAAAAKAEEKTTFDVILKAAGDKKIQVIKEVRALTGPGPERGQGPGRRRSQAREAGSAQGRGRGGQEAA